MQDRPTVDELLAAIEHFLDNEIVPNVPGSRGFHARVSANTIRIVRRELGLEEEQLAAEWQGLNALLGPEALPPDRVSLRTELQRRNGALCERIRGGAADEGDFHRAVVSHVREVVTAKLRVTNPDLLSRSLRDHTGH
jgi:hypothetical protein